MRYVYFATFMSTAGAAAAHPGHMAEVAGHGHWLGAAALGAAIVIGLWAGLKGRKPAQSGAASASDEDMQEA